MKRMNQTKSILLLAMVVILLTGAVGGTLAYLITNTDPVVNKFTPGSVTPEVTEDPFDGVTKNNVQIQNTGNVDAYIRAKVVGHWELNGNIVAPWTDSGESAIIYNTGDANNQWKKGNDGYYYYNSEVAAGQSTANLFNSYKAPEAPVKGAHLELTIVSQAVQADGLGVSSAEDAFAYVAANNPASPTSGN